MGRFRYELCDERSLAASFGRRPHLPLSLPRTWQLFHQVVLVLKCIQCQHEAVERCSAVNFPQKDREPVFAFGAYCQERPLGSNYPTITADVT